MRREVKHELLLERVLLGMLIFFFFFIHSLQTNHTTITTVAYSREVEYESIHRDIPARGDDNPGGRRLLTKQQQQQQRWASIYLQGVTATPVGDASLQSSSSSSSSGGRRILTSPAGGSSNSDGRRVLTNHRQWTVAAVVFTRIGKMTFPPTPHLT